MTLFRAQAPETKIITDLLYHKPEIREMPHGSRLYLVPPKNNQVIKLSVFWPYGTNIQSHKYQAKTALDLSLNGSSRHSADQIQEQFEYWGSVINTSTGLLNSCLGIKSASEFFIPTLNWFINNHSDAVFPDSEISTKKQISIAGLQRKMSTPRYWSYKECMELLYGTESMMTQFTTIEAIQEISREQIRLYHEQRLNPLNAIFMIAGDYTENTVETLIDALSGLKAAPSDKATPIKCNDVKSDIVEKVHPVENATQVSLFMAKELPVIGEKEFYTYSLLNIILGGYFGSRLMQEIREEKGLTYGIGSYIMQTHKGNVWCISGEMNSANSGLALDETRNILRSLVNNPPKGEELERAKRYYSGQLRGSFDGAFAMLGKIKGLLSRDYGFSHLDAAMDTIWNCGTDELCSIADNYLHPESFKTVMAGDIG